MKFTKYLRNQNLKSVEMFFDNTIDTRLTELTYTRDEIETMLQSLKDLIRSEMETELISFSHMNVLLLGQLFTQAEKWHLRMTADLSEIQNRDLLENVKSIELHNEIRMQSDRPRLQPLVDNTSSIELLRKEIERLKEENQTLETRLKEMKSEVQ
ncbi:hypothetical protein AAG570_010224 [Ranatra chinensis]|uniref:Leucine zipper transcription factor-like protein 1 n=1 Tax=Ranatra chinensis TaxID=642074 RepID=A0ABD0YY13_9HEMI